MSPLIDPQPGPSVTDVDILDVEADALLLPIDGARRGLEGDIARQFARRWPEDWDDMLKALKFPIPLGRTVAMPWEGDAPWRVYLFASTLYHVGVLDESENMAVVHQAFLEGLKLCIKHRARSLATPVLQGGWRLARTQALAAMLGPAPSALIASSDLRLHICQRSEGEEATGQSPQGGPLPQRPQ